MRQYIALGIVSAAGLAVLGSWLGGSSGSHALSDHDEPVVSAPRSAVAEDSPARTVAASIDRPSAEPSVPKAVASRAIAASFADARSYRALIEGLLPAARAGDREAQYFLFVALWYCEQAERVHFERGGVRLDLDDAVRREMARSNDRMIPTMRVAHERCQDVYTAAHRADWGRAEDWLARAADQGQPLAMVKSAVDIFLSVSTAGRIGLFGQRASHDEKRTIGQARALVRAALETPTPEVVFEFADLLGFLKPGDQDATQEDLWIWRYAACLRGLDCGPEAEWLQMSCATGAACVAGESGVEYLRRTARGEGIDPQRLDAAARDLDDRLDRQELDTLGIRWDGP